MKELLQGFSAAVLGVAMAATSAHAVSFTAGNGSLAAGLDVQASGSTLTFVLTNTSTGDVLVPSDVLTAVFFNATGSITEVSAVLTAGSSVVYGSQPSGGVVGGEWAYGANLVGAPGAATNGISSSGLGLFGNPTFPGANLAGPTAVDGVQYGLLSAGDNPLTGNTGITGSGGLVQNSVTFTFSCSSNSVCSSYLSSISNVSFQYGTSLTEPNLNVPEPASLLLLGAGLAGVSLFRRKTA